ncbi:Tryptophan--tRNA ligase [Drechslerella dactyloides]|uniref:tryptophan--tRNA ligase n=1 Tax=Drechslerella dactyloides TaxID=74499 RepID=A0AAD6J654_DREDA|nr:Tryptophan--tRNA ligase [Drechslerella dactyloides]
MKKRALATSQSTPSTHPEVVFSGIQPTGVPHLGNYLGALKQWVEMQDAAPPETTLLYCVVDLHAITQPQKPEDLARRRRETMAMLLAIGLRPDRCVIFEQSRVMAHTMLMWILTTLAPVNLLARQTQWKTKLAASEERSPLDPDGSSKLKLGLFAYPVLQAADVLLYRSTSVPVGEDQVQHLELARNLAGKFNRTFGETFPIPKVQLAPAKRVMSLSNPTAKMSKSGAPNSQINLDHSETEIRKRIRTALTDSIAGITYDPEGRPSVSNLVEILGRMTHRSDFNAVAEECAGLGMKEFKDRVADSVVGGLKNIGEEYHRIMREGDGYLDSLSQEGAEKAQWDKKASKLHEKKLAHKDAKAAAEEKEKTLARAAAREGSRTSNVASATSSAPLEASKWPVPSGGAQGETVTSATATATAEASAAREATSQSESESDGAEEGEGSSRYSRRKKIASNAWRYDEPEPEPGQEPEEVEPEPDYVSLTRDKLKSIEEKEQTREEIIDIWDHESGVRRGQSHDVNFGPKGNVVKVHRDEFKDVTEKIAKQATADRFRQRFASRKRSARATGENINFDDDEDELDALIGNMDVKGKPTGQSTETPQSSKRTTSPEITNLSSSEKRSGTQHLDDDWLDDMLG